MRRDRGFTFVELLIVIAVILILAAMAVPNLASSKAHANEAAVIQTLRNLSSAQAQIQALGAIDVDKDGVGECGFFGELAGEVAVRGSTANLVPPSFSRSFGRVISSRIMRSGYMFQVYLPALNGRGVAEDPNGGKADPTAVDADLSEHFWCTYAWPSSLYNTGTRAYFINQAGEILRSQNDSTGYDGSARVPNFDAAFVDADSMIGATALGLTGRDGETWELVGQ